MSSILKLLLPSLLVLSACSVQRKLNEMHDSTPQMSKTTAQMNETTKKLNDATNSLNSTTDELYDALRQGDAVTLRREGWKAILEAPTMPKKISEASKYFMSYELQLWNLHAQDKTMEKRNLLAQQAAREFFLEIEGLAPRDGSLWIKAEPRPRDINSAENRAASFNALAVTMNQINRKQLTTLSEDPSLPKISMESLMEDALLAKTEIETGSTRAERPDYINEVLAHEEKAIQILQTRYNFYPLLFIDMITDISDKNFFQKLFMVYITGWDLDLSRLNTSKMEMYQKEILSQSIQARDLLKRIGIQPQLDKDVARLLNKMNVKNESALREAPEAQAAQETLLNSLRDLQSN